MAPHLQAQLAEHHIPFNLPSMFGFCEREKLRLKKMTFEVIARKPINSLR